MQQAREFHYQGWRVVVFTAQIQAGWLWSYEIDGGLPVMVFDEGHPTEAAAIAVAESNARRCIEGMRRV
ncbi:hypothetical protein QN397_23550 [Variovorax sp. RTB1]|uniref:hypothetical protein n=1 Tax=Variovorax sp. RTB1 TaxID=3048631 RepID=UPI002B22CBEE|nr:hypothetical protein [Variovorax sp. RTB1]MEB0114260.1 hypothetical protein [Variovorax sp. RTB1]